MRPTAPTSSRRRAGVTLIECVAAVVLLGVAAPPMLLAVREAERSRADDALMHRARWLAAERLEDILADRHSRSRGFGHLQAANYPSEAAVAGFPALSRSVAFTAANASLTGASSDYLIATVTVGWRDAGGAARSLSISTVVARD